MEEHMKWRLQREKVKAKGDGAKGRVHWKREEAREIA